MIASQETLQSYWQDYLFLTKEMKKFLQNRDFELFFSLLDQREKLQNLIEEKEESVYYQLLETKELLRAIELANKDLMQVFQFVFNAMKRRENLSNAYEGGVNVAGQYLNRDT